MIAISVLYFFYRYFKLEDELCADHISACDLRSEMRKTKMSSLDDCLKLYTQPETVKTRI